MSENERQARRARLDALREAGIDPFPARVGSFVPAAEVRASHDTKDTPTLEAERPEVAVVGRVRSHRSFGKLIFFTLVEDGVALQASARKGETPADVFALARKLDVGDFVRVEGVVWRTQKGELTVATQGLTLLSKSLRPLPEKWHGLQDLEVRFRQRYLDLIANERAREIAILRSRTVTALRRFLEERRFLEVETPVLQPIYGGATARPFTTHHNLLDQDLFLRISDELYLKRLVVGGLDRVYEIGHNFRNEGISRKHNPEFTMLECYQAYADYQDMMDLVQQMIPAAALAALETTQVAHGEDSIDFSGDWPRITMHHAILEATGVDIQQAAELETLRGAAQQAGIDLSDASTWAQGVDQIFSERVEPNLVQPTFITHHPAALSPLAKRSPEDPRFVERFELFVAGMEIANAYSELNDPDDQRQRLREQAEFQAAGDEEAHPMDEDYLDALEHGLPPTGGLGVGVDRLVRVLADAPNLREVILFPHLKPERE